MISTFETKNGKYAELHRYEEPSRDDDGMPDGFSEIWEVYVFENPSSQEFETKTFLCEYNARLFLKENGYSEIVF